MTGTVNRQASEFPSDPAFPTSTDADSFRDIDVEKMASPRSTDFASAVNESLNMPVDGAAARRIGRRTHADGPDLISDENVRTVGARSYSAFTVTLPAGTTTAPGAAVMLLGDDPARTRIVLTNTPSTSTPLVGPLSQVANGQGFRMAEYSLFESTVTTAVYACVPAGITSTIQIGVWVERA